MKRFAPLMALVTLLLAACTVTVAPHQVIVTASETTVRPGARVSLSTRLNFESNSDILWRISSNDPRFPNAIDQALSNRTGTTTTYTAPMTDGTYTVSAETIDETSLPGQVQITVDSFLGAEVFDASASPNAPILTGEIGPGLSRVLGVRVSSAQAAQGSLLYIELGQNLDLEVRNPDRSPYASSSSSAFFARGLSGLSNAALSGQGVAPQDISVSRACRGACVIRRAAAETVFVRVTNRSNTLQTYTLYAYMEAPSDTGEPQNDARASAPTLSDFDRGAIETLGDVDYYRLGVSGDISFSAPAASTPIRDRLRADILNRDGTFVETIRPGQQYEPVLTGYFVRVYVEEDAFAGPSSVSGYVLEVIPAQ